MCFQLIIVFKVIFIEKLIVNKNTN